MTCNKHFEAQHFHRKMMYLEQILLLYFSFLYIWFYLILKLSFGMCNVLSKQTFYCLNAIFECNFCCKIYRLCVFVKFFVLLVFYLRYMRNKVEKLRTMLIFPTLKVFLEQWNSTLENVLTRQGNFLLSEKAQRDIKFYAIYKFSSYYDTKNVFLLTN